MKRILFVEDDAVITRIYVKKLTEAGFEVATAEDGLLAMKRLSEFKPNLVVLDLMIPKLNGLDVLKFIRNEPSLAQTRVFVFSNAFLNELWEETAALGVDEMLLKSSVTPPQLIDKVTKILDHTGPPVVPAKSPPPAAGGGQATTPKQSTGPGAAAARAGNAQESISEFRTRIHHEFFDQIPTIASGIRAACREFLGSTSGPAALLKLEALGRKIDFLTHMTSMAGCYRLAQLSSALEALLFDLEKARIPITESTRHTVGAAAEFLADYLRHADQADEQCMSTNSVLLVDDDAVSNRAVALALGRASLTVTAVEDGFQALEKLKQQSFDVVLLDIDMPGMDGLTLCKQMRNLPQHKSTPTIFFSKLSDAPTRARSIECGGDDLIAKPILPVELSVKVITHVLKHRLDQFAAGQKLEDRS